MNLNSIMLRRRGMILIPDKNIKNDDYENTNEIVKQYVTALNYNMMNLGYKLSKDAFDTLCACSISELDVIYKNTIDALKELKGADVEYHPMYPNFPREVIEKDELELYFNAIVHYLSGGTLYPVSEEEEKLPSIDFSTPKEIMIGDNSDVESFAKTLLAQSVAYSKQDKEDLEYLAKNGSLWMKESPTAYMPEKYINKENLITQTTLAMNMNPEYLKYFNGKYRTAIDVLRLMSSLSGGDVSLKDINTVKFKSFPKNLQRTFLMWLNNCSGLATDMAKNPSIWKKAVYGLHAGNYDMSDEAVKRKMETALKKGKIYKPVISKKQYEKNYKNVVQTISDLREDRLPKTFESRVQKLYEEKKYLEMAKLLTQQPGVMSRKMDLLLRNTAGTEREQIMGLFQKVANKCSAEVLYSGLSHFKHATDDKKIRSFYPKGGTANLYAVKENRETLDENVCDQMKMIYTCALMDLYKDKLPMGKVYVSPELEKYKAPMVLRNASKSGRSIPRGSRVQMEHDNKNKYLRGFIWWTNFKGNGNYENRVDVDLSAVIMDENLNKIDQITYYSLKGKHGVHSGDITSGGEEHGEGATELVDLDMDAYKAMGGKYVAFTVTNYTGYGFDQVPCRFGWMEREVVLDRTNFEPKTVKDASILSCKSTSVMPAIYDLDTREVIWSDLAIADATEFARNADNLNDRNTIAIYSILHNEFTDLMDAININVAVRGELVTDPREADIIICDNPEVVRTIAEQMNEKDKQQYLSEYMEIKNSLDERTTSDPRLEFIEKEIEKLALDFKPEVKMIEVSDPSAINALLVNVDKEADKTLLPEQKETEKQIETEDMELDDILKKMDKEKPNEELDINGLADLVRSDDENR